jgi:hypothetical protein
MPTLFAAGPAGRYRPLATSCPLFGVNLKPSGWKRGFAGCAGRGTARPATARARPRRAHRSGRTAAPAALDVGNEVAQASWHSTEPATSTPRVMVRKHRGRSAQVPPPEQVKHVRSQVMARSFQGVVNLDIRDSIPDLHTLADRPAAESATAQGPPAGSPTTTWRGPRPPLHRVTRRCDVHQSPGVCGAHTPRSVSASAQDQLRITTAL